MFRWLLKLIVVEPEGYFELFKDVDKKWIFRLRAPNGEIIAASEAYGSKQKCKQGITAVKKYSKKAITRQEVL